MTRWIMAFAALAGLSFSACSGHSSSAVPLKEQASTLAQSPPPNAPDPASLGGFDGDRAYEHVRQLVEIGPRPSGSEAIHKAQAYIVSQLKSYGCPVEQHDFHGSTDLGEISMKNIIAKIPGTSPNIVMYSTHYDTVRIPNFVGADDGGSGVGTLLELARLVCPRKGDLNVWIVFFDGEEAQGQWTNRESVQWKASNSTYGSREMAASMAMSGDLKHLKAMILADMIGPADLRIKRDTNSTPWLVNIIWDTAGSLGYGNIFINESYDVGGDDHFSFLHRGIAACDIIDFDVQTSYWHTPEDTLDKVAPRSLAVVGYVFLEVLPALERKFR